ncbi:class IV adenylate cyclase [Leptolyngbya sp. 7M]|uniref:class IV adenylate cyclase n=1 Tax=Leptolyngbya sp. 7M TaxID=2812896 RepID=UPI001B8B5998|nr:class IV adenylate cyclase [Leptolyngbya sp. 7M]QYO65782.1 class IV adenylate cyclase [Leptolyngbya sp. 7M]
MARLPVKIETEKKYRLGAKRVEELTAKLSELGAVFLKEVFEVNYQHRGGDMDERGATLRLRKIGDFTVLTYKEKVKSESGAKHKLEYETNVSDVEAMEKIIERLGYRLTAVYEKRRKYWQLGSVEVVLDELPFGLFMEIEGSIEEIEKAERLLGMREIEREPRGYPRLTIKYGKNVNGVMEARFERKASA